MYYDNRQTCFFQSIFESLEVDGMCIIITPSDMGAQYCIMNLLIENKILNLHKQKTKLFSIHVTTQGV